MYTAGSINSPASRSIIVESTLEFLQFNYHWYDFSAYLQWSNMDWLLFSYYFQSIRLTRSSDRDRWNTHYIKSLVTLFVHRPSLSGWWLPLGTGLLLLQCITQHCFNWSFSIIIRCLNLEDRICSRRSCLASCSFSSCCLITSTYQSLQLKYKVCQ